MTTIIETIKPKRGRRSKKEIEAANALIASTSTSVVDIFSSVNSGFQTPSTVVSGVPLLFASPTTGAFGHGSLQNGENIVITSLSSSETVPVEKKVPKEKK